MFNAEPIGADELRDLDERLLLSRYDAHQWRVITMAEYARLRSYIRKLESQVNADVTEQLKIREKNCSEMLEFLEHIFDCSEKIISGLRQDLCSVRSELERIQLSQ